MKKPQASALLQGEENPAAAGYKHAEKVTVGCIIGNILLTSA
jgi:hypothetical protein